MINDEKAKAYDMALEAARKELGVDRKEWKVVERVLRNIFPELRESEDERIRRTLVEYFGPEVQLDFVRGVPIQKIRDWLEKQKEQKPTPDWMPKFLDELRSKKNYFDWDEHRNIEGHILAIINWIAPNYFKEKEQKPHIKICPHSIKSKSYKENGYPIENCDYGLEIAHDILVKTSGEVRGYQTDDGIREHQTAIEAVRKAKEQKPAEKQDYSGLTDFERAIHRGFLCAGVENVPVGIIKETVQDCLAHLPVEWSEEDERILKGIIGKIDHDQTYGVSKAEMLSFLKRVRPQMNPIVAVDAGQLLKILPKRQEWSKDEEMYLSQAIETLEHENYSILADKLKSLRPSWKPSEEQMEALEVIVRYGDKESTHIKSIHDLYEQLKQL